MKCTRCGNLLNPNLTTCLRCGAPVSKAKTTEKRPTRADPKPNSRSKHKRAPQNKSKPSTPSSTRDKPAIPADHSHWETNTEDSPHFIWSIPIIAFLVVLVIASVVSNKEEAKPSMVEKQLRSSESPTPAERSITPVTSISKPAPKSKLIPNQLVRNVQVLLDSLGYETGPIDGLLGKTTRTAVRKFKKIIGLQSMVLWTSSYTIDYMN